MEKTQFTPISFEQTKSTEEDMCNSFTVRMTGWKAVTLEKKVLQAFLGNVFIMPCISYQEEIKATLILFPQIFMFDCECWDIQVWNNAWQDLFSFKKSFSITAFKHPVQDVCKTHKLNKIIFSTILKSLTALKS